MKLYFVRHGESEANVSQTISNRGWIHPLTERGRQQALLLAANLEAVGAAKIYTSPLRRAVETAEILAEKYKLPIEITDALREYDCGILEGRSDAESWRLHAEEKEKWLVEGNLAFRIEEGESFIDIQARFQPFLRNLIDRYLSSEVVILVGHGGTYQCMLPTVCVNLEREDGLNLPFHNTGCVVVESTQQGLVCRNWCGTKL
jgi:broad specificity phosphatase PhoE